MTSGSPKRAEASATRRSWAIASMSPPPRAWPCTAAIVTWGRAAKPSMMRCQRPASASASAGESVGISLMSAPAQNERPRPATTTARTSSMSARRASAASSASAIARLSALRASGRSRVQPGHRALRDQGGGGGVGHESSRFAMISRMISEVPEAIVHRRTSRKKRSTGNSLM